MLRVILVIVLALCYFSSAQNTEDNIKKDNLKDNKLTENIAEEKNIHRLQKVHYSIKRPLQSITKAPVKVHPTSKKKVTVKPSTNLVRPINNNNKLSILPTALKVYKTNKKIKDRPRKHKKKIMNQAIMALLLAYKLKFAALIPTLVMGLLLLLGTTALAGFFFALFAAILGLKAN